MKTTIDAMRKVVISLDALWRLAAVGPTTLTKQQTEHLFDAKSVLGEAIAHEEAQTVVTKVASPEREVLISHLRIMYKAYSNPHDLQAAEMLAADAHNEIKGWREDQRENMDNQVELQKIVNDLKAQQSVQPQGWKLVPIEPTQSMKSAMTAIIGMGYNPANKVQMYQATHTYKAMLT